MGPTLGFRPWFLSQSRAMRPVLQLIERSGPSHANVLISGEPGTGKSAVARVLHEASPRAGRPLLTVNGGGRPDDLPRRDERGAAGRSGGRPLQPRVAATPRHDRAAPAPLRERPEDIPPLAGRFLDEFTELHGGPARDFDAGAMAAMIRHPWPGNVRELRHAIESAVRVARRAVLTARDLGLRAWGARSPFDEAQGDPEHAEGSPRLEDLTLFEAEEVLIRRALARANGDWRWAAAALGLTPFDFRQRVRRHGLA